MCVCVCVCVKVTRETLRRGGGFTGYFGFLRYLRMASHKCMIWQ